MGSFITWFCKRIGKKKLNKSDLEDPTFKVAKAIHENSISLQFQMEECHRMLMDQVDLVNPEGHRLVPDVSKPLPLGGPLGDKGRRSTLSISKLKAAQYLDFGLEELVPSIWIESEREYDISTAYGISYWWFKHKEFYITRYSAPSDRSKVRSYMWILSVVSLKTLERYGYTYLKEIVLRRADYKEYKISEADFKNLHPNDFEDMYLLHLQGQLNHLSKDDKVYLFNAVNLWIRNIIIRKRVEDLHLKIESYQTKLNLTQPDWDASDFLFKENYTIVNKPNVVIYRDINDQKKMILQAVRPGMETRIWSKDDKRMSKDFMENIRVIPKYHSEDGNPARANIKQALSSYKDEDGVILFRQRQVHYRMLILDRHIQRNHENQERYEHVGPQDTRSQDGERPQDDDQRLDLADDLKEAQDHISSTITSHKTKITTSKYKISHEESKTTSRTQDQSEDC
ncbi:hypothetical protein Tco_0026319 [Tanacetum coccineum]